MDSRLGSRQGRLAVMASLLFGFVQLAVDWSNYSNPELIALAGVLLLLAGFTTTSQGPDPIGVVPAIWAGLAMVAAVAITIYSARTSLYEMSWMIYIAGLLAGALALRGRIIIAVVTLCVNSVMVSVFISAVLAADDTSVVRVSPIFSLLTLPIANFAVFLGWKLALRAAHWRLIEYRDADSQATARLQAADTARAQQLYAVQELNALVDPLLTKLERGMPLNDGDLRYARTLEYSLRDTICAPRMASTKIGLASTRSRERGVETVLLDDAGAPSVPLTGDQIEEIVEIIDSIASGRVTVRLVPSGRSHYATIVVHDSDQSHRYDLGGQND